MEKISKNIPIPSAMKAGRKSKYPWDTMSVGDSFVLPTSDYNAAIAYCTGANKRYKKKFITRMHEGKYRVWRAK